MIPQIPDAKEAKRLATEVLTSRDEEVLNDISKSINFAINDGKTSAYFYNYISPAVEKRLTNLGYKISAFNDPRDGSTITIDFS